MTCARCKHGVEATLPVLSVPVTHNAVLSLVSNRLGLASAGPQRVHASGSAREHGDKSNGVFAASGCMPIPGAADIAA